MENKYTYCDNINQYSRFKTREVMIGGIALGGDNPIRIQSMTNTDTLDTVKSAEQCMRIFDAGADYVRLTTQTPKHAENLTNIKQMLREKGYQGPLIADIHFTAKVAEVAAGIVEKVRINPGNYVDRKTAQPIETEEQYQEELNRIEEQFVKLIDICKANKTALRIGCNHGSLSGRIVNRYGDTVEGMAMAVIEFLDIARRHNFHEIVISMKASNTRVMVYAYRLLMNKMISQGMDYPLHLGVTEAGDGEDGRIKSAVGIGTLLADGLGDTVRVSLTEDPEFEVPVAKEIVNHFSHIKNHQKINALPHLLKNPFEYGKRETLQTTDIGMHRPAVVIADLSGQASILEADLYKLGYKFKPEGSWLGNDLTPDYIYIGQGFISTDYTRGLKFICDADDWAQNENTYPLFSSPVHFMNAKKRSDELNFIEVHNSTEIIENLVKLNSETKIVLVLSSDNEHIVADQRAFMQWLTKYGILFPVIVRATYSEPDFVSFQIKSACDAGPMFIDGYADGIMLGNEADRNPQNIVKTAFGILQASRTRMSKTEFISCPSCGRTLFEIQKVTENLKKRTGHLKGLKLAVMGCIVNGIGEMADADYGYVGAGVGKVSLYKGKEMVKKNISSETAIDELVQLIKENNDWKEPNQEE
jgi:(E)-4-hydroxy-3-methylbut-2-enyl-diphosphate synthase